jgi:hypothetical protein
MKGLEVAKVLPPNSYPNPLATEKFEKFRAANFKPVILI